MNILVFTYALNGLLMIAMPVGLAIYLTRRWKLAWRIWWIGGITLVISQVGHIPFNAMIAPLFSRYNFIALHPTVQMVIQAVFYGLSAGLFEECTRYIVLGFWLKKERSWRKGILFGAGHGGVEAIILGALVLFSYIQLLILRDAAPVQLAQVVPADQIELARAQLATYWSAPWYSTMLGAIERFLAIPCHIVLAVMVMQVFTRKNIGWLFAAIGYHAVWDAMAVIGPQTMSVYTIEAVLSVFSVLSIVIILLLKQPEPGTLPDPAPAAPQNPILQPVDETAENLENSRYQS